MTPYVINPPASPNPKLPLIFPSPYSSHYDQPNSPHGNSYHALRFPFSRNRPSALHPPLPSHEHGPLPERLFTRLAVMPHSLLTQSSKTPTDHEEQPVPQQFLRQLIHSTLNSSGTRRTRDGRLATGNPHRQPPATYGAHQSRNSSTPPSKRTKRHDHNQPHQLGPHIHKR